MDSAGGFRNDNINILDLGPQPSLCCDSINGKMSLSEYVSAKQPVSQPGVERTDAATGAGEPEGRILPVVLLTGGIAATSAVG